MKGSLVRILTLFWIEIRMTLRDRRSVFASLILPIIITPLLLFSSNWTVKKREHKLQEMVYQYAVTGSNASFARKTIELTQKRLALQKDETNHFLFYETNFVDTLTALNQGQIRFIVVGLTPAEAMVKHTKSKSTTQKRDVIDPELRPGILAPGIRIIYRADRDDSTTGMNKMVDALETTRHLQRNLLLHSKGMVQSSSDFATLVETNVATKGHVAGLALGRIATVLLLGFILMGGTVVAIDMLAGEKERGTLETLLTTSMTRFEIVAAKHLVILSVAIVITLIQMVNLLAYASFKLVPLPSHFIEALPPVTVLLLFVLYLPVAALASSALLFTSGFARSYKEAQLYFTPVFLLLLVPALSPILPGLTLRSAIILVPLSNVALAARDILVGSFDWPMIFLSWLITAGAALGVAWMSVRVLSEERFVTVGEKDAADYAGGFTLFSRQAPFWFAAMWAILLIVSNYTPQNDIRIQLFFNLIIVFLGGCFLMIRKYHLVPREVLALRRPKPTAFLAVLIGVPGGMLSSIGLFRFASLFFPVPQKTIEAFSETLILSNIDTFQLILFMAVLPGIIEEITFRGVLLHSLHKRLHPVLLVFVVGIVFGFFHMVIFRFAPTAFLGVLLSAVTLLTGSIFPSMLWHALNNTMALLSNSEDVISQLDPVYYLAGPVLLGCSFWILWRDRTPYPGLRSGKSKHKTHQEISF